MLKLIVQHSPSLVAFVCGVHLRLSKPQSQHVVRLTDALVVSEARHKTIASLYGSSPADDRKQRVTTK